MDDQEIVDLLADTDKLLKSQNIVRMPTEITPEDRIYRKVVTELNAQFIVSGNYPNLKNLGEKIEELNTLTPVGLKGLIDRVNKTLIKRGLPDYKIKFKRDDNLDPEFIAALNLILDTMDKRPIAAKLKAIGMTTGQFKSFLRIKRYDELYKSQIDKLMANDIWYEAKLALAKNVQEGDLSTIKYVGELENIFVPQRDFDPRILQVFMGSILELILKHVEPTKARIIAEEMETIAFQQLGMGNKAIEVEAS